MTCVMRLARLLQTSKVLTRVAFLFFFSSMVKIYGQYSTPLNVIATHLITADSKSLSLKISTHSEKIIPDIMQFNSSVSVNTHLETQH